MADDDAPKVRQPKPGEPGYEPPTARISKVRRMLDAGVATADVIAWCAMITPGTPEKDGEAAIAAKLWTVGERKARDYIRLAKEQAEADDQGDSQATKRAMNRSRVLKIVHMAVAKGDLYSAIRAQHMLNLIDKSYDEAPADALNPAVSEDEAIARIDHAASTLALARSRGALPPPKPTVIDADSTESDDDGEPAIAPGAPAN